MKLNLTLNLGKEELQWLQVSAVEKDMTEAEFLECLIFLLRKNEEDDKKLSEESYRRSRHSIKKKPAKNE